MATSRRVSNVRTGAPAPATKTPSEAIVAAAKTEATIVDGLGRTLKIKRPGALDHMRLAGIVGAEKARNEAYMMFPILATSVVEINGDVEPPVNTLREIENLVFRLEEVGLTAIAQAFAEHFEAPQIDVAALKN